LELRQKKSGVRSSVETKIEALLLDKQVQGWITLMKAFQTVYRPLEQALLREGCSVPRFQVLFHLYFNGPLAATQIARELFVTRGNISMFLKRLQGDKLITVSRASPSSTRPLYCLTSQGYAFFEGLFPRHIGRVKSLMPVLGRSSLKELEQMGRRKILGQI